MKKKKLRRLRFLEVILLIFLPATVIIIGVVAIQLRAPKVEVPQSSTPLNTYKLSGLNPSDILTDVNYYDDKELNLTGVVSYGEKSCSNLICQKDNPCCGCDASRDLVIQDIKTNLMQQSEIKIFNPSRSSICQKKSQSCDYDCADWIIGGVYNLDATLVVVRPMGLTLSRGYLEYYLEVKNKKYIPIPSPDLENKNILDQILGAILKPILPSPEP